MGSSPAAVTKTNIMSVILTKVFFFLFNSFKRCLILAIYLHFLLLLYGRNLTTEFTDSTSNQTFSPFSSVTPSLISFRSWFLWLFGAFLFFTRNSILLSCCLIFLPNTWSKKHLNNDFSQPYQISKILLYGLSHHNFGELTLSFFNHLSWHLQWCI